MSNNDSQITPKNENPNDGQQRTFNEELEVAGSQLVERVKELIEEGNIRRLIIRNPDGRTLLEIPLTFGAVAGGALVIFFGPVLAALAVIGALVARIKIEIVRDEVDAIEQDVKNAAGSVKKKVEDLTDEDNR
ncbi:MAG: DUF4342 domain-containing protein [Anaerolineae bacterium]|nr:DUF4342 domain-containing protein [Anaerolineae bacterium]